VVSVGAVASYPCLGQRLAVGVGWRSCQGAVAVWIHGGVMRYGEGRAGRRGSTEGWHGMGDGMEGRRAGRRGEVACRSARA
jgi:hypothetical protein